MTENATVNMRMRRVAQVVVLLAAAASLVPTPAPAALATPGNPIVPAAAGGTAGGSEPGPLPDVRRKTSVPVHPVPAAKPAGSGVKPRAAPAVSWPAAGTATVPVTPSTRPADRPPVTPGGPPISVRRAADPAAAPPPGPRSAPV